MNYPLFRQGRLALRANICYPLFWQGRIGYTLFLQGRLALRANICYPLFWQGRLTIVDVLTSIPSVDQKSFSVLIVW